MNRVGRHSATRSMPCGMFLPVCIATIVNTIAAIAYSEPLYFSSGTTIYRAESTTREYRTFTQSAYGGFRDAACDTAGNLIAVNSSGQVVRIAEDGISTLLATVGDSLDRITCFSTTEYAVSAYNSGVIKKITPSGEVSYFATLPLPVRGLDYDPSGNLYAHTGNSLYCVERNGGVSLVRDWTGYPVQDLARLPDGGFVACGASGPVVIQPDPATLVISPQPYSGPNGIGSSLFPYAVSANRHGDVAFLQGFSPFNSGSWLMLNGSSITGGARFVMDSVAFKFSAVPEPSTYAMALAGLACGGYSLFRRRLVR